MKIDKNIISEYIINKMGYTNVSAITIIQKYQLNGDTLINLLFLSSGIYFYRSILESNYLKYYRKYKLKELLKSI